ncbi:hypothetical protein V6N11_051617 [Hibiscus sabdariffa]|uniref:Uncharacterized protein n=1 Tax=Hibiscus sabdariffa TaxID=183260 RepID=A0ABR2U7L8_9ROSI
MNIKCPDPIDEEDQCIWRWTPKHNFELKSAYSTMVGSLWAPKQPIWIIIWSLKVPQRVRLFLWIAYQQKLMTNGERCCRHFSSSPRCSDCSSYTETVIHALRDCNVTHRLWLQILPATLTRHFFSMNLHTWFSCNLSTNFLHPVLKLSWNILFASLTWQLWKRRNNFVFNNISSSETDTINHGITWAKYYYGITCKGTIGGLIRDDNGVWLIGFAKVIGHSSSLQAELWATLEGMKLAWEQGYPRVVVQSNCKQAVELIRSLDLSTFSLVRAINRLRHLNWLTEIVWIPRSKPTCRCLSKDS